STAILRRFPRRSCEHSLLHQRAFPVYASRMTLSFTTAGESHGPALVSVLEGMPAGLPLLAADVNTELARRQQGYGRGRRMKIEADPIEVLSRARARQD